MTRDGALIVFARQPVAGRVKTRLAASLGAKVATKVYAHLLDRAIEIATQSKFSTRYLYTSDRQEVTYFHQRLDANEWHVREQCVGNIGQRMSDAIGEALIEHAFVVLIGSDVADNSVEDLNAAFDALSSSENRVVFGPSADGGYWLIGSSKPCPEVFCNIPWSTSDVAQMTLRRLRANGVEVILTAERHDVDETSDLRFLRGWAGGS